MTEENLIKQELSAKESKELDKVTKEAALEGKKEAAKEAKEALKEERTFEEKKYEERAGIAYIYSSYNNTIVHITDMAGNTLSRVSGGMVTKSDRLKSNPTIAMFVAKKAAERAKDLGITALYIRVRAQTNALGTGPGGHAAVKSLSKEGFKIISVLDTTRIPRGGPKKKGGKRGRRV
jgi:small subunit ribosomal protein S11